MAGLRTEFDFTLPKGYVGSDGMLHRQGTMRLATARDEIEPLRDRTIDGPDDPYLTILVLARVITSLGSLPAVGVEQVEGLFAADLAFLQDLYGIINFGDPADVAELQASVLPDEDDADEADSDAMDDGAMSGLNASDNGDVDDDTADAVTAEEPTRSSRRRSRVEEVSSASS
jgi:hypothetical protein